MASPNNKNLPLLAKSSASITFLTLPRKIRQEILLQSLPAFDTSIPLSRWPESLSKLRRDISNRVLSLREVDPRLLEDVYSVDTRMLQELEELMLMTIERNKMIIREDKAFLAKEKALLAEQERKLLALGYVVRHGRLEEA
ncbi:hypothetical protein EG327_006774 [Venturia inaequalis]|uniref:Uncharacterized protein n=1 Tax=Venturia inaequalis TaxID=5025 RepID=A0A8H3ZJZ2_VENIN|nr:hypothetical protein EG327_006774 [Venturia inaequalis]